MSEERFLKAIDFIGKKKYKEAFEVFDQILYGESDTAIRSASLNYLAWMYQQGLYVEKSDNKALELWLKGACLGDFHAQMSVGECYQQGIGVEQDDFKAYCWYEVAKKFDVNAELGEILDHLLSSTRLKLEGQELKESEAMVQKILENVEQATKLS